MPLADLIAGQILEAPTPVELHQIAASIRKPTETHLNEKIAGAYNLALGELAFVNGVPIDFDPEDTHQVSISIAQRDLHIAALTLTSNELMLGLEKELFKDRDPKNLFLIYRTQPTVEVVRNVDDFNIHFIVWATVKIIELGEFDFMLATKEGLQKIVCKSLEEKERYTADKHRIINTKTALNNRLYSVEATIEQLEVEYNTTIKNMLQEYLLDLLEEE